MSEFRSENNDSNALKAVQLWTECGIRKKVEMVIN
jgi:hypothetical protein